jgi:hypothetical protein
MTSLRGWAASAALALVVGCGGATELPTATSGGSGGSSSGSGGSGAGGGGPSSNPLVGTWQTSVDTQGTIAVETIDLQGDGTVIETVQLTSVGGASCKGSIQFTGVTWTSTATTLTIAGAGAACTGGFSCSDGLNQGCPQTSLTTMTCNYMLTGMDDTLVLDCAGGSTVTFTRQG